MVQNPPARGTAATHTTHRPPRLAQMGVIQQGHSAAPRYCSAWQCIQTTHPTTALLTHRRALHSYTHALFQSNHNGIRGTNCLETPETKKCVTPSLTSAQNVHWLMTSALPPQRPLLLVSPIRSDLRTSFRTLLVH